MKHLKQVIALAVFACFSVSFLISGAVAAVAEHDTSYGCIEEHEPLRNLDKVGDTGDSDSCKPPEHCKDHCTTCAYIKNLSTLRIAPLTSNGSSVATDALCDVINKCSGYSLIGLHTLTGLKIKLNN